jgi:hypothetical protein
MSSLSLRLPDSLHRKIRELAERDHISINQFVATAAAEKTAALLTAVYLEERGSRANPKLFDRVLSRVPDVPPVSGDEFPGAKGKSKRARSAAKPGRVPSARKKRSSRRG